MTLYISKYIESESVTHSLVNLHFYVLLCFKPKLAKLLKHQEMASNIHRMQNKHLVARAPPYTLLGRSTYLDTKWWEGA